MYLWHRLKHRHFFRHINQQVFLLVIMAITVPLIATAIITYVFSVQTTKQEYENASGLILNNLSFNVDQYLHHIEIGTLSAQMNSELQQALMNWPKNELVHTQIQYEGSIEHFISTIETTVQDVDSVQIFVGNHVFYSSLISKRGSNVKDIMKKDWYQHTLKKQGGITLFGTHRPFHRGNASKVITLTRAINQSGTRNPLGVLLIDIRLDSIREILQLSESQNRNFVILGENGQVIYASDRREIIPGEMLQADAQSLRQSLKGKSGSYYASVLGQQSFVNYVTSSYSGWTVVQYTSKAKMTATAHTLRTVILGLAIVSLLIGFLFLYVLYRWVTKPVIQLSNQVRRIGKGDFSQITHSNRQDEFGVLYRGIDKMVVDLRRYIDRVSILKSQTERSHYNALKSQIQPHFLANALESIQMKAIIEDKRDIAEMAGVLGQLFRIHTQTGKEVVSIEEELRHIHLYVKVQQFRFLDKIQYVEMVEPDCMNIPILHFTLQPLIENSIVHGLEPKDGNGRVTLTTYLANHHLIISVGDNGVGMTESRLADLKQRLNRSDNLEDKHIGLSNIHQQIQLYYGKKYGITIDSAAGKGTVVCVHIPI